MSGENDHIGKKKSKNVKIELDPDYRKTFNLTTDASSDALGVVLSQYNRPITMISRTLSQTERIYATNERELLAVIWALKALRHYLYGVSKINIFTDNQTLI